MIVDLCYEKQVSDDAVTSQYMYVKTNYAICLTIEVQQGLWKVKYKFTYTYFSNECSPFVCPVDEQELITWRTTNGITWAHISD